MFDENRRKNKEENLKLDDIGILGIDPEEFE